MYLIDFYIHMSTYSSFSQNLYLAMVKLGHMWRTWKIKSVCCNIYFLEFFGDNQHFLWMTMVWCGDSALDLIFHEESFGDVCKSIGCWLLGVLNMLFSWLIKIWTRCYDVSRSGRLFWFTLNHTNFGTDLIFSTTYLNFYITKCQYSGLNPFPLHYMQYIVSVNPIILHMITSQFWIM